jgi:hypothetical protein
MKKNVVFLVAVKSKDPKLDDKHGGFKYLDVSIRTWKYWCEKNDVELFIYDTPSEEDTQKYRATWTRWFDVFDQLDSANISYNKILVVDGSTMVRWDCPNFFDMVGEDLVAFKAMENMRWVYEAVTGYSGLFNNFEFDCVKYIDCGFQIFTEKHKQFLAELKEYYYSNFDVVKHYHDTVKRGTDQTPYNYMLQLKDVKVDVNGLPSEFMLNHLQRFDWFSHNWQLGDKTPFFLKYGYIWKFSGFPTRGTRYDLMEQTWQAIKGFYE